MADYDNLTQGQLVQTTAHINKWQKTQRLMIGSTRVADLADGAELYMKTGTYTGNGGATQAVTGVGFTPRFVVIFANLDPHGAFALFGLKTNQNAANAYVSINQYEADHIISLDSDGFTVGDGTASTNGNTMNINATGYTYIAFR